MNTTAAVRLSFLRTLVAIALLLGAGLGWLWSQQVVQEITQTALRGGGGPDLMMILGEFHMLFTSYVIPCLGAAVILTALNLAGCALCPSGKS